MSNNLAYATGTARPEVRAYFYGENRNPPHRKFYEAALTGTSVIVHYGRIGVTNILHVYECGNASAARAKFDGLKREKLSSRKGYTDYSHTRSRYGAEVAARRDAAPRVSRAVAINVATNVDSTASVEVADRASQILAELSLDAMNFQPAPAAPKELYSARFGLLETDAAVAPTRAPALPSDRFSGLEIDDEVFDPSKADPRFAGLDLDDEPTPKAPAPKAPAAPAVHVAPAVFAAEDSTPLAILDRQIQEYVNRGQEVPYDLVARRRQLRDIARNR